MCAMKKLFNERARLVIYLDQDELVRMGILAKSNGETLVEWAREVLRSELIDGVAIQTAQPFPAPTGAPARMKQVTREELEKKYPPSNCCSACGHPKHKHGGFKTACQEERCTCGGFR